jgi:SAM-dependent methyltransferase
MKCLNLGCGTRFHPDWVNLDFVASSPEVIKHDLNKGIPFPDASFDVVYHSHVLEHFDKPSGHRFMQDCYRVLRPQGCLRVAVPDLEQIAQIYLSALEKSLAGDPIWQKNYDWILLELLDQGCRNQSGGQMLEALKQVDSERLPFIIQRIGIEAENIIAALNNTTNQNTLKSGLRHRFWQLREHLYRLILRYEYEALQIGRLRQSGEIHYQMYDRYSLTKLLTDIGFVNIQQQEANQSQIENWTTFNLDTEPDGRVYKPDSLFIEAQRS